MAPAGLRDFAERFGATYDVSQAREWFVTWLHNHLTADEYADAPTGIDRGLASHLGAAYRHTTAAEQMLSKIGSYPPAFAAYIPKSFPGVLAATEYLYAAVPEWQARIEALVSEGLRRAPADVQVRWDRGQFLPSGVPVLDEGLVVEPQRWLRQRGLDAVAGPYETALRELLEGRESPERLKNVIRDCYEAVEHLAKVTTGRDADLSANRELLVSRLGLPLDIAALLQEWVRFGNPYRHGESLQGRPTVPLDRAEEFLYEAGLLIRAIATRHAAR